MDSYFTNTIWLRNAVKLIGIEFNNLNLNQLKLINESMRDMTEHPAALERIAGFQLFIDR